MLANVSGWLYSWGMAKHEVVNKILEYLDDQRTNLVREMSVHHEDSPAYGELEAMYDVYDHLITKLEDDYR